MFKQTIIIYPDDTDNPDLIAYIINGKTGIWSAFAQHGHGQQQQSKYS